MNPTRLYLPLGRNCMKRDTRLHIECESDGNRVFILGEKDVRVMEITEGWFLDEVLYACDLFRYRRILRLPRDWQVNLLSIFESRTKEVSSCHTLYWIKDTTQRRGTKQRCALVCNPTSELLRPAHGPPVAVRVLEAGVFEVKGVPWARAQQVWEVEEL